MNNDLHTSIKAIEPIAPHEIAAQASLADASESASSWRRIALVCAVLVGATALAYVLPMRSWLADSGRVRQTLASLGYWTVPVSILIVSALVCCGVPRLLLCALAGMVLGFWWGLVVAQAGALLGYYCVFLFTRWGGRAWALGRWPALQKWANLAHDHGIIGVIFLRQLPIHGTLINFALGLSHAKHRHFLIGTAIGTLPEAIPTTLAGAGLVKASRKVAAGYGVMAVAGLALVWIGCGYLLRAMRNSKAGAEMLAEAANLKNVSAGLKGIGPSLSGAGE